MKSKKTIALVILVAALVVLGVIYWPKEGKAPEAPAGQVPESASGTPGVQVGVSASSSGGVTVTNTIGWHTYDSAQYKMSFAYPPDWQLGAEAPIMLGNFGFKYVNQEIIPVGGAEIDMVGTVAPGSLSDIVNTEIDKASITSSGTVAAAGGKCEEYFYGGSYAPGYPSKNIAVYCPGPELLKIYLSYRASDPKGPSYVSIFNQILGTISRK